MWYYLSALIDSGCGTLPGQYLHTTLLTLTTVIMLPMMQPAYGAYKAVYQRLKMQYHLRYTARTAAAHRLVYSVSHAEQHDKPGHPEAATRITAIEQALAQHDFQHQTQLVPNNLMDEHAVMRSLELVHPAGYLQRVQEICGSLQVRPAASVNPFSQTFDTRSDDR